MSNLTFRLATIDDVPAIRALLADDALGQTREDMSDEGLKKYQTAFAAIDTSPENELWLAVEGRDVVGTWQMTYIAYLSRAGNLRCLIEAVRTRSDRRGQGIGKKMMLHALDLARERGCGLAQLTTDKTRADAHRFYLSLGFKNSHEGMKIQL